MIKKKTKVTVFGEEQKERNLKPIEFVKFLSSDGYLIPSINKPCDYDNVDCIKKGVGHYDVFDAWNNRNDHKDTFLGYYNDGIV